eukprot:1517206-Amphidinium_carterae.1
MELGIEGSSPTGVISFWRIQLGSGVPAITQPTLAQWASKAAPKARAPAPDLFTQTRKLKLCAWVWRRG